MVRIRLCVESFCLAVISLLATASMASNHAESQSLLIQHLYEEGLEPTDHILVSTRGDAGFWTMGITGGAQVFRTFPSGDPRHFKDYRGSVGEELAVQAFDTLLSRYFFKMKNLYDMRLYPDLMDADSYYSVHASLGGHAKSVTFHAFLVPESIRPLFDLLGDATRDLPDSGLYGTFISASEMLLDLPPGETPLTEHAFAGLQRVTPNRPIFDFDELDIEGLLGLLFALQQPDSFVHIGPAQIPALDDLRGESPIFYVQKDDRTYRIRIWQRTS